MKKMEERSDNGNSGKKRTIMNRQTRLVSDVLGQKGL
jgi:hypothetical protein